MQLKLEHECNVIATPEEEDCDSVCVWKRYMVMHRIPSANTATMLNHGLHLN